MAVDLALQQFTYVFHNCTDAVIWAVELSHVDLSFLAEEAISNCINGSKKYSKYDIETY